MSAIKSFMRDESGAAAAEYALILAIVGTVLGLSMVALRGVINTAITNATAAITTVNGAAAGG